MRNIISFSIAALLFAHCGGEAGKSVPQENLSRVDSMPSLPQPLEIIDYRQLALRFDSTVYDIHATGDYWPLIWFDSTNKNFSQPIAAIYTAMGDVRQGPKVNKGMFHEALANMGAVLGATLVGVNKANQHELDYVSMLKNYFNKDVGWDIMMNNTAPEVALLGGGYGRDWWYDVFPNVLFYAIYDKYPHAPGFDTLARTIAEKFYAADSILKGNYNYSYFDYRQMKPVTNNICIQPDAAAGHAYVLYSAYKKFGDKKYLEGAKSAMKALESQPENPTYEVLMPFGALLAAQLNAEQGTSFDIAKMLAWTFDGTPKCREGWGVLIGRWNGIDISGIVGSTVDHGGYGFLMNTYDAAWPLVPMVRYDQRYATAIGKWMLNAANASRFFYPEYMPKEHQAIPELAAATKGVIGYEGIVQRATYDQYAHIPGPVAQGDGPKWVPGKNPDVSQFSVYGSGHAGIFGSIIRPTEEAGILQLNLLATDFFHGPAYGSYLYYNPYKEKKQVTITLEGEKKFDLYNTVAGKFIAEGVSGQASIQLDPEQSAVIICVPAGGKRTREGQQLLVDGIIVDYRVQP
ncbi:MAG: hypothetical protein P0Y53_00305 [Candidatus Pseudobacter hemicellulosilyticus]|uniref:Uncharacterized protein n=1 Tax=Candidatus Pseudobacter hemicellulosilyticus TaxID=3121375 RepID=A0AAJ5WX31_9BACT|nr:MAG: hypothetical protein P0Y53_00305 [Pseudobacter sp.]